MIITKTRANSLSDVKALNMWGFNLKDISIFEKMPNIEIASLSVNQISSLAPLSHCHYLRELYLRQNNISDINEVMHLTGLRYLHSLSLSQNPIANSPNYRKSIIQMLPQLEKLDDVDVSITTTSNQQRTSRIKPTQSFVEEPQTSAQNTQSQRLIHVNQSQPEISWNNRFNEHQRRSDEGALTAILALLPELSPESLSIVLQTICDLSKQQSE